MVSPFGPISEDCNCGPQIFDTREMLMYDLVRGELLPGRCNI